MKHEHVYRHDHQTVASLYQVLDSYLAFFNCSRRHQSLEYETPWDVSRGKDPGGGSSGPQFRTLAGAKEWGVEKFSLRVEAAAPLQFAALTCVAAPTRESLSLSDASLSLKSRSLA